MLMDLGKPTYEEDFERHFLAAAADFYAKEAQEYIASSKAPEYMLKVRRQRSRRHLF
jgi:cullin 3